MTNLRLLCLIALGLLGCAADPPTKPKAPDMTELDTAYRGPTGLFDAETAIAVQELVEAKVKALADLIIVQARVEEMLMAIGEDVSVAPPTRTVTVEGDGFARVTRICSGHGTPAPPIDKDANGFLELSAGFTEGGIDPVVFGGATDCLEQVADTPLTITGSVNVHIGKNFQLDAQMDTPVLFQLDVEMMIGDRPVFGSGFDFRVCHATDSECEAGHVELLLHLFDDTSLVFYFQAATGTGGFRDSSGLWTCDFLAGECIGPQAQAVAIPRYSL